MRVREEVLDELHLDIIDILGSQYDGDIATAANVAEQITEKVEFILEEGDE